MRAPWQAWHCPSLGMHACMALPKAHTQGMRPVANALHVWHAWRWARLLQGTRSGVHSRFECKHMRASKLQRLRALKEHFVYAVTRAHCRLRRLPHTCVTAVGETTDRGLHKEMGSKPPPVSHPPCTHAILAMQESAEISQHTASSLEIPSTRVIQGGGRKAGACGHVPHLPHMHAHAPRSTLICAYAQEGAGAEC